MRARSSLAAIAAVLLLTSSCTHTQVWVASGESIDAMGKAFLATATALDTLYTRHVISEAQYERWRAFTAYFQPVYDMAAERWKHGDDTAAEHAAAVLAALSAELAVFTAMSRGRPEPQARELPRCPSEWCDERALYAEGPL